jgi:pimeloyl-ACP methyl ester carboxylesterase
MDLRGHGRSQASKTGDYAIESLAANIGAVADALRLQRFVLVGHRMGGAAAAAYASMHPDRVAGLVLVGAPGSRGLGEPKGDGGSEERLRPNDGGLLAVAAEGRARGN